MFDKEILKGQAGVITGGSSGIGLAMAKYLTAHGAKTTLIGRDPDKLARATAELGEAAGFSAGDVREADDVKRNMEDHMKAHGKIDFLINNAAGNFLCPIEKMSENAFQSVLRIVTMGTFLWSKAAIPQMKAAKHGRIVNIGTTYSWGHAAYVAHSGAAKAAVLNLTRTMAVEWGRYGVTANLIAPGPVAETEGVRRLMPDERLKQKLLGMVPTPRMAEGWEIAAMALYLISPLGGFINGAAIPVDGGMSLTIPGLLPAGLPLEGVFG